MEILASGGWVALPFPVSSSCALPSASLSSLWSHAAPRRHCLPLSSPPPLLAVHGEPPEAALGQHHTVGSFASLHTAAVQSARCRPQPWCRRRRPSPNLGIRASYSRKFGRFSPRLLPVLMARSAPTPQGIRSSQSYGELSPVCSSMSRQSGALDPGS